ncbi:hypothetical protein SteCoe_21792 [Stentor coeruleus]|uniref:Uncharacterized protein n=1 Tax=Stentor coeruleus TaxID=5963 RepID=A0A1R2BNS6_9CILI|nr:hypothetical protein SteCoe_21792 [Stentor coeruleus]
MKESPLIKLSNIRRDVQSWLEVSKIPEIDEKDSMIWSLRKTNQELAEKIKSSEELLAKNMTALRHEIGARDKEIVRLNKEIYNKDQEKNKLVKEIQNYQGLLQESEQEKNNMAKHHEEILADINLRHEQEIYILKKIKRS